MRRLLILLLLAGGLMSAPAAWAVQPGEALDDPVLEARARALSAEIRCLVCQNQSIDDSDAELARELRLLIRERMVAGDSDDEIKAYLVSRYGEFVLLRPPVNLVTAVLWFGPVVLLVLGALAAVFYLKAQRTPEDGIAGALSEDERRRFDALLEETEEAQTSAQDEERGEDTRS
jgi:cytochrome c-type biogenesis protein CcmH